MDIRYSNDDRIFNIHRDGVPYISFDMLDRLGVPNLYSTRFEAWDDTRGEGTGLLRTAVMNWETAGEASPVCRENRDRLAHQLGSSLSMEVITDQKHTNYVHVASREDFGVPTVGSFALHRQYVDGVVTDIPGALLTAFGADCPPVYIADPVRKAAGLVHAGWKGTLGRIPAVAIAQMAVKFGCDPSDMYAAIGPGVCRDCYEMGDEVYDAFAEQWGREDAEELLSPYPVKEDAPAPHAENCSRRGWKYHLDLREANRLTLLRVGIPADHIAVSNVCTMCNAGTFYTYRGRRMENEQAAMMVNRFDL